MSSPPSMKPSPDAFIKRKQSAVGATTTTTSTTNNNTTTTTRTTAAIIASTTLTTTTTTPPASATTSTSSTPASIVDSATVAGASASTMAPPSPSPSSFSQEDCYCGEEEGLRRRTPQNTCANIKTSDSPFIHNAATAVTATTTATVTPTETNQSESSLTTDKEQLEKPPLQTPAYPVNAQLPYIPFEEVQKHNTENDFWCVINGVVYDVTKLLPYHPGGMEPLMDYAGADATEAFEDMGHSWTARCLAEDYAIGILEEYASPEALASASACAAAAARSSAAAAGGSSAAAATARRTGCGATGKRPVPEAASAHTKITDIPAIKDPNIQTAATASSGSYCSKKKVTVKEGLGQFLLNAGVLALLLVLGATAAMYYIFTEL